MNATEGDIWGSLCRDLDPRGGSDHTVFGASAHLGVAHNEQFFNIFIYVYIYTRTCVHTDRQDGAKVDLQLFIWKIMQ